MAFLPILTPQKLVRIIEKQGFIRTRQSGSHAVFIHISGRKTSIPIHRKTIGKGLLRKILRDIKISPKELKELM